LNLLRQSPNTTGSPQSFSNAALAWYFVIIWGSGFLATKIGIQYAAPFTFLSLRFIVGLIFLAPILFFLKPRWPTTRMEWLHIVVAGLLMHAIHLGGSHYAQYLGMSAGVTAIILASQPLLTTLFVAVAGKAADKSGGKARSGAWGSEGPSRRQWLGIVIGLAGVAMVVWHKVDIAAVTIGSLIAVATGVAALTTGTLYQRRYCASADLRSSSFAQFAISLAVLLPLSVVYEGAHVQFAWPLVFALLFLVVFASIFAVNALHTLMRRGEATRVSSMLYLPPIVAIALEWPMFGVVPTPISLVGVAITCAGVVLVNSVANPAARN
jgi:drug/metabolite transporter (DMT)-like permease